MFPAGNGGTIELVYTQVSTNGCYFMFLLLSTCESSCPEKEHQIASDICSNYTGSCTGFLDFKIHYKLRQWQSCGKHAFYYHIDNALSPYKWMPNVICCLCVFCSLYLKVCERSLSGSGAGPNAAAAAQFVRAEMLPCGYLIRPCEGGGSIIHIVDHLNLEV